MEKITALECAVEDVPEETADLSTREANQPRPHQRPLTPAQAFEAHVAMCFECHHRNMFETGFGYCPEAYRILAEMA
jgi:hypothetical protein